MSPAPVRWLEAAALALFAFSIAWWLVVYGQVIANTGMSPSGTLPCLIYTSDRCSLAMALCRDWHLFGIRRYFAEPLWLALALAAVALLFGKQTTAGRAGLKR